MGHPKDITISALRLVIILNTILQSTAFFQLTSDLSGEPIPDNFPVRALRYTLEGQTTLAVATRSYYKCTAYTSLWSTYNELKENITQLLPDKDEMLEWVHRKMTRIGAIVNAGIKDDLALCDSGSELNKSSWTRSSEITKTCYHSHTLRTSCFLNWESSLKFYPVPTFLNISKGNIEKYSIDSTGQKIPISLNSYRKYSTHALLVIAEPAVKKTVIDLNCFFSPEKYACMDNELGNFIELTDVYSVDEVVRNCTYTACYDITKDEAIKAQKNVEASKTAHKRRRRHIRGELYQSAKGQPGYFSKDNFTEENPTAPASVADLRKMEHHLMMLHQTDLFNFVTLQHQMLELQRVSLHTVLSLSKLDNMLLSRLFDNHYKTQFINYDHYTTLQDDDFEPFQNSNCNANKTKIFRSGRYFEKLDSEKCLTWTNASRVPLFKAKHLVFPAISPIQHSVTDSEIGWDFLKENIKTIEQAKILRGYGPNIEETGLADVLQLKPGELLAIFGALYGILGFSATSNALFIIFAVIFICRRR